MTDISGPFLQAALFAELVLQEPNNLFSAIRIVDRQTQLAVGPDLPDDMPPLLSTLTILIGLKPGDTRGRYAIRIVPEAPSGQKLPEISLPVNFPGGQPDHGATFILPMQVQLAEEGLYWFDVIWVDARSGSEDRLLTRMPLRVVYQPQPTPPGGTAES